MAGCWWFKCPAIHCISYRSSNKKESWPEKTLSMVESKQSVFQRWPNKNPSFSDNTEKRLMMSVKFKLGG